jgi:predicted lipid-binding transport protein (Tim44 family)
MDNRSLSYSEKVSAADQRHRDRLWEAKAALVSAQSAAAAEYDATISTATIDSPNKVFRAAMDDADKRYAAAVAESVAIRMQDFDEAWRAHQNDDGYLRRA